MPPPCPPAHMLLCSSACRCASTTHFGPFPPSKREGTLHCSSGLLFHVCRYMCSLDVSLCGFVCLCYLVGLFLPAFPPAPVNFSHTVTILIH
ncbi:hypothetical protein FKM82_002398 [Ascaphus truei]